MHIATFIHEEYRVTCTLVDSNVDLEATYSCNIFSISDSPARPDFFPV